jgi:hypothetical protein
MPCNPSAHVKQNGDVNARPVPLGAFSIAFGNPANAGMLYGTTMLVDLRIQAAMRDAHPMGETDRLLETIGEDGGRWYDKVEDSFHMRVETLSPSEFVDGAQRFLSDVGLNGYTHISINGQSLQSQGTSEGPDLQEAVGLCKSILQKDGSSLHTIEFDSYGKNEQFLLFLNLYYSRRHRNDQAPVEVEIKAMSNELGPKDGESFSDYKARMKALDSDVQKTARLYDTIGAKKKALYSDFAHHLSEAFPGTELQLYESVSPGEG